MEYDKSVVNRLKRIEGQIRGVLNMMEQNKDCGEVITQLSASRTGIDRTIGLVVSMNLEQCVRENMDNGEDTKELVKEAVNLLVKADKRHNESKGVR
ncbi:metal-sensitive transcriptional regulator [Gracilibacillus marinus]|uniref:Metal-sensitive transcriptional regulator n=1 Tax=Gracilibacillus marinus TaxID=630535 RepID=A0ABV8VTS5_9BACI